MRARRACTPGRSALIRLVTEQRRQRDEFIAVASEFCELYERATQLGGERFLGGLHRLLPRLQAAAAELPLPDDEIPDDDLDVRLTQEESQAVDWPVHEVLKQIEWSAIQDELPESTAACPSLAGPAGFVYDDLSGIYHDLKEGFRLIEAGRPEGEAVFGWRELFWSHWGYHNAEALRVIHYFAASYLGGLKGP
jgi:Domain of unknown function (DUF5063)